MYNFMGMILVAQASFIVSLLCILFKNLFQVHVNYRIVLVDLIELSSIF